MFQQNDEYDALIEAIDDGFFYDPYETSENYATRAFDAVMNAHMSNAPTNYIDLIADVATDVVAYRREKFGDRPRDLDDQHLLDFFGQAFANIIAFEVNENR